MTAEEEAKKWLLDHGYTQFKDGCWQHNGYEADVHAVLTEFIEDKQKCLNTRQ